MKEFNLELAKSGHHVQTRDGRPARIICYDRKEKDYPIVALIEHNDGTETTVHYTIDGKFFIDGVDEYDLVMAPVKREGWINIYKDNSSGNKIYDTKEEATKYSNISGYLTTIKIEWEE